MQPQRPEPSAPYFRSINHFWSHLEKVEIWQKVHNIKRVDFTIKPQNSRGAGTGFLLRLPQAEIQAGSKIAQGGKLGAAAYARALRLPTVESNDLEHGANDQAPRYPEWRAMILNMAPMIGL